MKVLFVYYVPSGGVETLNRQRCRALRERGAEGHCLYFRKGAGLQNMKDLTVFVTGDDIEIKRLLEKERYDAIVVTSDYATLLKLRLLGYRGPLILEIQGFGPKNVAKSELTAAVPYVKRHASALLTPHTPHIDELLAALYPAKPKYRIYNCFDADAFGYENAGAPPHPIVAWIGRIEDNKNWLEFLLIGARLIRDYDRRLRMAMYEDPALSLPEERERMELWIGRLGLRDYIDFYPNVPNALMKTHLSAIGDSGGLLCSTSKVEGAPYAVLEAMSCRCPVLSTRSDGVSSSLYHNRTGKYYELGNIDDAYAEAVELMKNRPLRERIRAEAVRHVKERFAPRRYCEDFLAMLRELQR